MARYLFVAGDSFEGLLSSEELEGIEGHDVVYRDAATDTFYEEVEEFDAAVVLGADEEDIVAGIREAGTDVMSPHPYDDAAQVPLDAYGIEGLYDGAEASSSTAPAADRYGLDRDGRIKCLVGKVGLDGHDRGAHVVSRAFRDAGFEVIYSGLHNTPEEIIQAAVQEDVDVLGISILSGAHNTLIPKIVDGLDEYGALDDTLLLVGGTIPADDEEELYDLGVAEVFGPGTPLEETITFIEGNVPER